MEATLAEPVLVLNRLWQAVNVCLVVTFWLTMYLVRGGGNEPVFLCGLSGAFLLTGVLSNYFGIQIRFGSSTSFMAVFAILMVFISAFPILMGLSVFLYAVEMTGLNPRIVFLALGIIGLLLILEGTVWTHHLINHTSHPYRAKGK